MFFHLQGVVVLEVEPKSSGVVPLVYSICCFRINIRLNLLLHIDVYLEFLELPLIAIDFRYQCAVAVDEDDVVVVHSA